MSSKHIDYLRREHARLDAEIDREARQRRPDEVLIARLKKLKLAIKDQIAAWSNDTGGSGRPSALCDELPSGIDRGS